jgi:glycosyltransferase involved in cell wall biosynthesis
MRVLHIIASVNPESGGPIEGLVQSAIAWTRLGHVSHIVSLDRPSDPWVASCPIKTFALGIDNNTHLDYRKFIPWLRYGYTPRFVPWLKRHAKDYDVIILNGLWNYTTFGAWRTFKNSRIPYYVFTHGMLDPWFKKTYPIKHIFKQFFWWFSEGPLLHNARAVLFTSEEERFTVRGSFYPYQVNELVVGYGTADASGDPGLQIEVFLEKFPRLRGRRFLLFLGRIHPKKGCDLLISAFARYATIYPNVDLVIAGPDQVGWRPELEALAQDMGIANRIVWPGMLQGDLKWGAFRAAEAFILPSHQENFGVVVVEAMACGKPVLISNKVNIWREVEASGAGLVNTDDENGTAAMIEKFLAFDRDTIRKMEIAARRCFIDRFHIDNFSSNLINRIRKSLDHRAVPEASR